MLFDDSLRAVLVCFLDMAATLEVCDMLCFQGCVFS